MTPHLLERPPAARPDPWATAPVMAGRHRHRLGWAMVVVVVVAAGAIALLLFRQAPSTSPPLPPSAPPEPDIAASVPFDVTMDVAEVATMDNGELLGRQTTIPEHAVDTATRQIDDVLTRYLDAEFVADETRFSDDPLDDLLSRRASNALSDDDRAGLGALGLSVQAVQGAPVTATARILTSESDVVVAAVRYDAHASIVTDDGEIVPLRQRATAIFVREGEGWRAEAMNTVLDVALPDQEVTR
jgi:hypothetical protein